MKAKVLILILLFVVQLTKSQSFDMSSSWTIITTNTLDDTFLEISTYKLHGDTIIEDKTYTKLFLNDNYYSALRETEDNKVYVRFPDYLDIEQLIYDFDWHPNDTLYHEAHTCENRQIHAILENEIDSIQLLDGKYYQYASGYSDRYSDCYRVVGKTIIRGIGDTAGFFYSSFERPADGSQYALLCFCIDDELIYLNPDYKDCDANPIDTNINFVTTDNDSEIKLYHSPSSQFVTIEFPPNLNVDRFEIFDMKGSLIRAYQVHGKYKIEVGNIAKGVYIYSAISKNKQKLSGKIIIQ